MSHAGWRFWSIAYTLLILLAGTNIPTPLYRGYAREFGFSPLVLTLIFAAYVGALIPSLVLCGPLSDAIGRRRVLLPALALAALGSVLFALATSTGWLFAARILQGIAVGAASGPLSAALVEFEPTGDHRKAALVSTAVSISGISVGPVLGGALAQYAPAPYVLPFVVEVGLLLPATVAVLTLPAATHTTPWRPRRPELPAELRPVFATSGVASFLAFAVVGLFLTLVPTYVANLSGSGNLLLGSAAAALMGASSTIAQLIGYGRPARALELLGLPMLATGLALLAISGSVRSLPVLLAATVIAGIGQGLAFLGGLTAVNRAAPGDRRAEVLSSFFVACYCGTGGPVIGMGLLATAIPLSTAVQYGAGVVALACVILLLALARTHRRTPVNA
ncbi:MULTISPECIES: MFS transporter [unclassified Nocardia]|uniref:MFS transporter n=1 Tax=unclassified Nocardia TaxID=2637762 RepID=UPI001CE42185|nr:MULTISPECIES: MFS transporter [unclassified Nocardia]